jgi:GntR family transcriptional regulator, rspAB operon transcriptional repressor
MESDNVYHRLRSSILLCRFQPGDCLSEPGLAKQCNTSRTPIREACNRLAQEGWLTRIPHRGFMVKPISIREIVETYEFRMLLETHTARTTARIASTEQVDLLRSLILVENAPKTPMQKILKANDEFHLTIARLAGNRKITDELKLTLEFVHRLDILSTRSDRSWVPHSEILAAIAAHNSAKAARAMAAHIQDARDRILKLFGS